jgi:hypothetical protein
MPSPCRALQAACVQMQHGRMKSKQALQAPSPVQLCIDCEPSLPVLWKHPPSVLLVASTISATQQAFGQSLLHSSSYPFVANVALLGLQQALAGDIVHLLWLHQNLAGHKWVVFTDSCNRARTELNCCWCSPSASQSG